MQLPAALVAVSITGLLLPQFALAQYPARSIRVLVADAPGSAPDTITRLVGERLGALLGQSIVVETRTGSNGNIAMEAAARSAPDGHTLVFCADSMIVINPHTYTKMAIDTLKDLVPVSALAAQPNFLLSAHPSVPVKSFEEFIEYAKKANPPLAYASAGNGSQHQMGMEMLKLRAGIPLVHVPYKGAGPALVALMAGEVSVIIAGATSIPQIRSGKLRGLAATGRSRSPLLPDLPTIGEVYPGYVLTTWLGLFAPAGVPDSVMTTLRAEINRVLTMPEVKARLNATGGLEPYVATPQQFAERIRTDYEKYAALVKQIGIRID